MGSGTKLVVSTQAGAETQPTAGTSTTTKTSEISQADLSGDFSPTDDLSILMARSRNSFQSGYQYTLENFDRDAMKNDQIWRETQSRIEFLKMRNITMSNSADRNSLARKLVADKEWKQLDKFTKLMEMIMYLQYEPVFSKYCFYGCWCMPSGGADINRVWGQPVDEIDATCRDMQLCYKCAKLDYGNQCKDTVGYSYKGYEVNGERRIRCMDEQNTCRRAICECDRRLAMDLAKLEDTASMDFHSKYGTFNFQEQCVPQCTGSSCPKWDQCCGDYPERFPYNSQDGAKQCCGQKTYYKSVLSCCQGDRLQPYGTCKYGAN